MSFRLSPLMCAMSVLVAAPALGEELATSQELGRPGEAPEADPVAPSPCCGAAIVPAGHFEVEANYSGDGVRGNFVNTSDLTLKYSLTDRIQLQVGTRNLFVGGGDLSPRAVDGISPGLKLVFLDEGDLTPQLAASVHAVFPTQPAADALQTTIDAYGMVYASKDIGQLHLDATASLTIADLTGQLALQGGASLVATWEFNEQWGVGTGPYSSFGSEERLGIDGGWFACVNFSPFPELAFTAGAEAGFFTDTRTFSVFAGVAWVPTASAAVPLAKQGVPRFGTELIAVR